MTPEQAGAFLSVDLNVIAKNWQSLQDKLGKKTKLASVLKANAYGLNLEKVAKKLFEQGCDTFFVAYTFEGIALREILPKAKIYVLHGVLPQTELDFLRYNLVPVLSSALQVKRWNHLGHKENILLPAALHVDTGMTRFALTKENLKALCLKKPEYLKFELVMSHLSCADSSKETSEKQLLCFDEICAELKEAFSYDFQKSLSATDGAALSPAFHKDIVRLGIGLYDEAISLEAKILQIQEVKKGQSIGYGSTYVFDKSAKVATLAIGYADGYPRSLSNKGFVSLLGYKAPIVGRVSMDLTTIDVSDIPLDILQACPTVEIFGKDCKIKEIAKIAGTIDYELLTQLSARFFRIYID